MNSVIADVYKERKNGVLPYVHAFYGAGAMLAPVFVTALVSLERPESFARPYLILGLLSLTCAALMLLTGKRMKPQTPYADMEEIRGRARQNPAEIFREGSAWLFLLSGFMNLSFQTGLTTWLPRYCSLVWDYDLTAAGLMVTMYFMGALVMRLLSPFVYRKLGVKRYYQLTLLVSAALYLVFLLLPMPDWCRKAMVFALGLLQGATVPTLVILCCDAFPERTASASSVVVTGVSLASMVSPVVLGKLLTIDPADGHAEHNRLHRDSGAGAAKIEKGMTKPGGQRMSARSSFACELTASRCRRQGRICRSCSSRISRRPRRARAWRAREPRRRWCRCCGCP